MRELVWHASTPHDVADATGTDLDDGLRHAEVRRRMSRYGPNKLIRAEKASVVKIFIEQFRSLMVLLLTAAAAIAFTMGDLPEGIAIAVVIFLNAGIGFTVELKANRAIEALQRLGVQDTVVVRDGRRVEVNALDLVPGDLVEFEAGDSVTADCRLVEASDLRVKEAALTGESVPVRKSIEKIDDESAPLGDRKNMLYKGTTVVSGSARAVVIATGMSTQVGRIAELVTFERHEETPMQTGLRQLGRTLIFLSLGVAGIVVAGGLLAGGPERPADLVLTGLALAIAAVPEGLPAVATIALAVGMWRMARRNALIRKLPAVETLGSATVICTDKTGTLTENEMTATVYYLLDGRIEATGAGFQPEGFFLKDGRRLDPLALPNLKLALYCGVLCNNASLGRDDAGQWQITGDPTEGSLVVAAAKAGIDQEQLRERYREIREVPFSAESARMATLHENPEGGVVAFVKGAPASVMEICSRALGPGGEQPLDAPLSAQIVREHESMAGQALRVLALAYKITPAQDEPYRDLVFLGLVGLHDPPREEVAEAISLFKKAGIRTVMITGDHPRTAEAIGRMLGIIDRPGGAVISGRELKELSPDELAAHVDTVSVYARITPEDKVKIVEALQRKNHVVAMLGDGVNDAAALKHADIGVAMGIEGTDLAKETSDIVLLDDRFVSVAAAVQQGRLVLSNVKKFIHYLFSCNLSEILTVFFGSISGLPLPLLPLQILWLNLVTDVFPALSLALEPVERGLMSRPPRPKGEPIFSARIKRSVLGHGLLMTTATLGSFFYALQTTGDKQLAQTVCFMTIAFTQLSHAWTSRKESMPIRSLRDALSNRYLLGAAVLVIGLQMVAIYLPGLSQLLRTTALTPEWLGTVMLFSIVPILAGQALRWAALHAGRKQK